MSRIIPLTQGQSAIVDDADYAWLSPHKWFAQKNDHGGFYAARRDGGRIVFMHRQINDTPEGLVTDHRDGDGLNNQRANLRDATQLQNQMNRRPNRRGTSLLKGAWFDGNPRNRKKWRSAIRVGGRLKYLGRFETEQAAAAAYAAAAREHFGEFACLSGKTV